MSCRFPVSLALAAMVAVGVAAPAAAQSMSVGTFLTRAAPLRANPLMALVSPDYAPLKAEADTAVRRALSRSARAATTAW